MLYYYKAVKTKLDIKDIIKNINMLGMISFRDINWQLLNSGMDRPPVVLPTLLDI